MATSFARPRLRGPELLRAVAEGTAGEVGDAFLRGLVRSVAEALAAKLVLVAEATDPDGIHVRVVAGWYDGAQIEEPFEYDTAGQPCALVPGQTLVSFPEGLVAALPRGPGRDRDGAGELPRRVPARLAGHLPRPPRRARRAPDGGRARGRRGAADLRRARRRGARAAQPGRALQASRARVIEAADAERRRVGRDLHDGAQQRLLAVSNLLKVARRKPESAE